jgi:hypothetical protein
MKKDSLLSFALIVLFGSFFVIPARAAESSFAASGTPVTQSIWKVRVLVNSPKEKVNTFAGNVSFSPELLKLSMIETAGSVINFWVEEPKAEGDSVRFAGITPGGYQGENGELVTLVFTGVKEGKGSLKFENGEAYLNDGKGTKTDLKTSELAFEVKSGNGQATPEQKDTTPPQAFAIEVGRSAMVLDNKWFAVFSTADKETGVDHYEVQESRNKLPNDSAWQKAISPYQIADQSLSSYIFVKAVDKGGNSKVAVYAPHPKTANYRTIGFWGILLLFSASILYIWRYLRGQRTRKIS